MTLILWTNKLSSTNDKDVLTWSLWTQQDHSSNPSPRYHVGVQNYILQKNEVSAPFPLEEAKTR